MEDIYNITLRPFYEGTRERGGQNPGGGSGWVRSNHIVSSVGAQMRMNMILHPHNLDIL